MKEELVHNKVAEIALLTGCRAVEAYYIAVAKHVNDVLIINDKIMKHNVLRARVKSYLTIKTTRHL